MKVSVKLSKEEVIAFEEAAKRFGIVSDIECAYAEEADGGRTYEAENDSSTVCLLFDTLVRHSEKIKRVFIAIKTYANTITDLLGCGLLDEISSIMKRGK